MNVSRSGFGSVWRYAKLAFGSSMILAALSGMLLPERESIQRRYRLETEGRVAVAKVIDKSLSESSSSNDGLSSSHLSAAGRAGGIIGGFMAGAKLARATNGQPSGNGATVKQDYYLHYEFSAPTGAVLRDKQVVTRWQYDQMKIGTDLKAIYHPQSPEIHRLQGYSQPFEPVPFSVRFAASLSLLALGGFLVWRNWGASGSPPAGPSVGQSGVDRRFVRTSTPPVLAEPRHAPNQLRRSGGFGRR